MRSVHDAVTASSGTASYGEAIVYHYVETRAERLARNVECGPVFPDSTEDRWVTDLAGVAEAADELAALAKMVDPNVMQETTLAITGDVEWGR